MDSTRTASNLDRWCERNEPQVSIRFDLGQTSHSCKSKLARWNKSRLIDNLQHKLLTTYLKLNDKHLNAEVSLSRMHSFLQSSSVLTDITFLMADDSSLAGDPYPR